MPIPDFQSLMLPLLETVSDGKEHSNREIADVLARKFMLSDEDLQRILPSGQQSVFANRLGWAKSHLKKAKLLDSPTRGTTRLTEEGHRVLAKPPEKLDIRFLKQFPSYDWHIYKPTNKEGGNSDGEIESTPEELLETSHLTLREQLAGELLEKVKTCSPAFFERLVVNLLVGMGYGGSLADAGQAVGRSGDGGIDGIIKEDKLGLDVVCIQAKRWENCVGRPVVQAFAGSMEGMRARKGVLITTGPISKDAEEYVGKIERKIVLINGKKLADLMIDHNIGVTTARTYSVKKMDLDYFAEEEA